MSSAAEQEAVQEPAGRAVEPGQPSGRAAPVTVRTEVTGTEAAGAVRTEDPNGLRVAAAQAVRPEVTGTEAVRAEPRAPVVWPGAPMPLGARFRVGADGVAGTDFALWAGGAEAVEVCLFDERGVERAAR
ncbi:hypothetical protein SCYAM73S_04164 [Streptomyces cyaneofuscatus]